MLGVNGCIRKWAQKYFQQTKYLHEFDASVKASSSLKLLSLFVFWNYRYIFQSSSYKMFIFIYVLPSFTLSTVMFQVKLSTALLSLRPFSPSFSPSRERSSWKSIPVKHESRSIIEAEQLGNRQIKFRWNIAVKRMDDFPQLSLNQTDMFT